MIDFRFKKYCTPYKHRRCGGSQLFIYCTALTRIRTYSKIVRSDSGSKLVHTGARSMERPGVVQETGTHRKGDERIHKLRIT